MRVLYLFLAIFIVSCNRQPDYLEKALSMSGANRYELEKVLNHYKKNPEDKLKYKAACFLIENMPGKYTLDTMSMVANQPYFDKLAETLSTNGEYGRGEMNKICDSIKEVHKQTANLSPVFISDLKTIKAEFLIRHIDCRFESKHQSLWADSISFDDFCKYILPYRTTNSYWDGSHDFFTEKYTPFIDSLNSLQTLGQYIDSEIKEKYINGGIFYREYYPFLYPVTFRNLLQSHIGVCSDICSVSIEAVRSMNIPAILNVIPCWGNGSNSHFMAELIKNVPIRLYDNTQQIKTKPEDELISDMFWTQDIIRANEGIPSVINISSCRTVPKIFRETYALQHKNLYFQAKGEEIPQFFKNPHLEDITEKYLECADATVVFDTSLSNRFVYLCCYNQDMITFEPVAWAKIKHNKALFHDMRINIGNS
jgi:hypothetical protein